MLPISNVIQISVDQGQSGLGEFNVNNLALFTSDQFLSNPDGDSYRIYLSPADVAADFGLDTETYRQAAAVFSQSPNILAGGGCLIVIPTIVYLAETVLEAITRTEEMIYYCGIICTDYDADMMALAAAEPATGAVLACSALKERYREVLAAGLQLPPRWIYLAAPREVLAARLTRRSGHFMPPSLLDSQLDTLEPPDNALLVDATRTPEAICAEVVAALRAEA